MDAPRALVFRPLVKGNEALGTRLLLTVCKAQAVNLNFHWFVLMCCHLTLGLKAILKKHYSIYILHRTSRGRGGVLSIQPSTQIQLNARAFDKINEPFT